ncbi:MAG: glycosyltransferase family 39 protein [Candidatus Obscuribacterales bacterium]|nr:glycosyltransferase family 39 protein [Candidatus Obscuribacterales bacterium]
MAAQLNQNKTKNNLDWTAADWSVLVFLFVLAACLFLPGLSNFGILDPSDGYYSEGAREMLERGDFLTPYLNYKPWFDKPIFTYWLIIGSYKLFGVSELAARLPGALCGISLVLFLYFFARQFMSKRPALLSALVLVSMPMFLIVGHMSLTDMPLCCLVWLATGSLLVGSTRQSRLILWLGYLFAGLGLLCKGPLAAFLIGLNLLIFLALTNRSLAQLWQSLKKLDCLPGIIIALAVALPWYVTETVITKGAFFQHFFLNENINRAMGAVDHKASFWYYLPVVLGGAFPWTILLFAFLPYSFRFWRRQNPLTERLAALGLFSFLMITLFLSILPTKLVTYILPVYPGLALFMGSSLHKLMRLKNPRQYVWTGVLLFVVAATALFYINFAKSKLPPLPDLLSGMLLVVCLAYLAYTLFLWRRQSYVALNILLSSAIFSCAVLVPSGLKLGYDMKCADFHRLIRQVGEQNINPLLVGRRNPSAMFYLRKQINFLPSAEVLVERLKASSADQWLLIDKGCFDIVKQAGVETQIVSQQGDWYLLRFGQNR